MLYLLLEGRPPRTKEIYGGRGDNKVDDNLLDIGRKTYLLRFISIYVPIENRNEVPASSQQNAPFRRSTCVHREHRIVPVVLYYSQVDVECCGIKVRSVFSASSKGFKHTESTSCA
jgi:hypothetical protein